jgi:hypothetical protein
MKSKVCKLCKNNLSVENFWKNPNNKDGLFGKCKSCVNKVKEVNAIKNQKYLEENLWTCSTCSLTLSLTEENFYKRKDSYTGFQYRCKNCLKKDPARYNRLINKDSLLFYLKDIYHGAKNRAIKKNIHFSLTLEFLNNL